MGLGLIAKPILKRNFSLITFGIAQVAMDIEPGIGMLAGAAVLHGPTHTILGALLIACLVMLVAPSASTYLLKKWNKEVAHYDMPWLAQFEFVSKTSLITGAFFGTLSHVFLDSLMHRDIHPLLPFSSVNPWLDLISSSQVYQLCSIAGGVGFVVWLVMAWRAKIAKTVYVHDLQEPLAMKTPHVFLALWTRELWLTWVWIFLISIAPCLLLDTASPSVFALLIGVLIGIPALLFNLLRNSASVSKISRSLFIIVLVPVLMMTYATKLDEQIPKNARPIIRAIESFRLETDRYPDTLEMLMPKYLANIPDLKFSLFQPQVTYRVTGGKPYLSIPTSSGGVFGHYEYDFLTKTWANLS